MGLVELSRTATRELPDIELRRCVGERGQGKATYPSKLVIGSTHLIDGIRSRGDSRTRCAEQDSQISRKTGGRNEAARAVFRLAVAYCLECLDMPGRILAILS